MSVKRKVTVPLGSSGTEITSRRTLGPARTVQGTPVSVIRRGGEHGVGALDKLRGARSGYVTGLRTAWIAWSDLWSGDSEITVAGRLKRLSALRSGSARSVPSP